MNINAINTVLYFQLTLQYTLDKPPEFAIILAFLAGSVEFLMGVLKLGKYYLRLKQNSK